MIKMPVMSDNEAQGSEESDLISTSRMINVIHAAEDELSSGAFFTSSQLRAKYLEKD